VDKSKLKILLYFISFFLIHQKNNAQQFSGLHKQLNELHIVNKDINLSIYHKELPLDSLMSIKSIEGFKGRDSDLTTIRATINYKGSNYKYLEAYEADSLLSHFEKSLSGLKGDQLIERYGKVLSTESSKIITEITVEDSSHTIGKLFISLEPDESSKKQKQVISKATWDVKSKSYPTLPWGSNDYYYKTDGKETGKSDLNLSDLRMLYGIPLNEYIMSVPLPKGEIYSLKKIKPPVINPSGVNPNPTQLIAEGQVRQNLTKYYLRQIEYFFRKYYLKYQQQNKLTVITEDQNLKLNAVNAEISGDKSVWENIQVIYYVNAHKKDQENASLNVWITIDGKFVKTKPHGSPSADYINKKGLDLDNSSYQDKCKEYGQKLYIEFEKFLNSK